jgi:hypothetical protein
MLRSLPVPFQAILWPLFGAVLILATGRLLPAWVRRLLAGAAAAASLAAIWSLRSGGAERVQLDWSPLNLFRAGPALSAGDIALPAALALASVAVALALGIGGRQPRSPWHGLLLILLAGALTTTLAANLLTLAIGSALMDLALMGLALWCGQRSEDAEDSERRPLLALTAALPGLAATLILVLCALRLDAEVGHTSFPARQIPPSVLVLLGVAAILRTQIFPLHPRRVRGAAGAAALLLPAGAGLYLLARVQAVAPVIPAEALPALLGSLALLAGGLLAWSGSAAARRQSGGGPGALWRGLLIHQVGAGLLFALVLPGTSPWPLLSLMLALALLAVWWDADTVVAPFTLPARLQSARQWVGQRVGPRLEPWWQHRQQQLAERFGFLARWRDSWIARRGAVLLPALAVASLAGLPLTAGARARWPLYAALLQDGNPHLWSLLVADTFLAAGLWLGLSDLFTPARRLRPLALVGMLFLAAVLLLSGMGAGQGLGWQPVHIRGVSAWGMGLLYIVPWLVGIWLASLGLRWRQIAPLVQSIVGLDWLYRALGRLGSILEGAGYWLGQVGEGEGWWGWALIILALAAIFLTGS